MLPIKTGTDGALVVPLTRRWHESAAALPANDKAGTVFRTFPTRSIDTVPIMPKLETNPVGTGMTQNTTVIDPMDFMKGVNDF